MFKSIGIAVERENKITFRFLDFDIVFKGLRTLKDRNVYKVEPESPVGNQLLITIIKSKTFQLSLKYDPCLKTNPMPIILSIISTV